MRSIAERAREFIGRSLTMDAAKASEEFNRIALALFAAQFNNLTVYGQYCRKRGATPETVREWKAIPAMPTAAFKEYELSSVAPEERTAVFHSSGTTGRNPSRHFHGADSLALYEASLWPWFERHFFAGTRPPMKLLFLTPETAPHSSLVRMFQTVRRRGGDDGSMFVGTIAEDGGWQIDFARAVDFLRGAVEPVGVLGTAFSFVHLLDHLAEQGARIILPSGSRAMETGGYKGRSRVVPKAQLRRLMTRWLGLPDKNIVTEYGMSELGSQAYEREGVLYFPPWARMQIISPETGAEVDDLGLLRVHDLANAWSLIAVQTEDLAERAGEGFRLVGRAAEAEARGCSLMTR